LILNFPFYKDIKSVSTNFFKFIFMKKLLLIFAFFVFQLNFGQQKATTSYFIRHAEKVDNSQNPDLSEKGLERATL
jgi:hypothetical protein